jgi:DNA-binding response OmpR family regulator
MTLVLMAEDVPAISLALEDALSDGGYTAVVVSSNAAALAWLDDHTPDLAMLDLVLSDGSTVEVARVLRNRGVPTLFLSGHWRTLPSDMDDVIWIEKPVSFGQLIDALDSLRDQMRRSQT